jgi:hypothetical protein
VFEGTVSLKLPDFAIAMRLVSRGGERIALK